MFENEKVVETKQCKNCSCSFEITDKDLEFYEKVSPVFGGTKYSIPSPTLCPDCRQQRRLSFRNERNLYKRKCDFTGKEVVSIYSPDKPYKVYSQDIWWSDKWDALDYGRDFDFNKSFFEQFSELDKVFPKMSTAVQNSENCDYTNDTGDSKDCYMSFRTHYSNNIIYTYRGNRSSDSMDCYQIKNCENLFECFQADTCQNSYYLYNCSNCHSSYFLWNCVGCSNCFLCYNLNNSTYSILNKTYTKEEYNHKIIELKSSPQKLEEAKSIYFDLIKNKIFFINLNNINIQNSVGNDLINCNNCIDCFMMKGCENVVHSWDNVGYKNAMDSYSGGDSEYTYETTAAKRGYKNTFTLRTRDGKDILYSMFCFGSTDCFGCIGLRNKSYCIFNKQYTKEQYEVLVPKIIEHMMKTGEWGEFFPSSISPFGYNETVAQEYFPLTKEEALKKGFKWSDYEQPFPKVEKIIQASKLPENISDIPDDILNWAIECEVTKKPFRIIKQELEFYRKHNLPIPKRHPDQRHLDRMKLRNPRKLFDRKCDKCGIDMKTTYSPDRKEIVYCEECYIGEVY